MVSMLVLTAVPDAQLLRLRAAASSAFTLEPVADGPEMVEAIRLRPVELAVVDPRDGPGIGVREIERLRQMFPSLSLLFYTALTPETAELLLALGRLGIRRAIFARFDDAPSSLRKALQGEVEHTVFRKVARSLADLLDTLPDQLRTALESTLTSPVEAPTVSLMAERAQLGRRTCERLFARSGLPSPRMVLVVARLLYAHRLLLDPGLTVEDVATKLGYSRPRTMQAHLREVFGLTAGEMRLSLSPDDALQIVKARYFNAPLRQVAS
jgi:AraC-like DNA-binding protein